MRKGADELEKMRISSRMNDEVSRRVLENLKEGMTETEVAAMYLSIAKELGASGPSFEPLVCFGANCAEPHHSSDDTVLRRGDSVICDVGLTWNRYCSDMTRTVFFGEPTDEQRRVYEIVERAK